MTALQALLWFTLWTLLVMFSYVNWRFVEVLFRGKSAASWTRGTSIEVPAVVKRMNDAHFNCVENLPVFAAIVLVAAAMGKSAVADAYAAYVLYARVAQSVVHIIGVNHWLVLVRATLFGIQLVLFALMIWGLLH
jgi:uncharacterized MAPEG superfamily protein